MKKSSCILYLLSITVLTGFTANAQTYWSTNFTEAEGYTPGGTVVGVDGWTASRMDGPNTDAGVVTHQSNPAMRVFSTSTGAATDQNTRIQNATMSVPGFAIIQTRIAYEWKTSPTTGTAAIFYADVSAQRAFQLRFHQTDGITIETGDGVIPILGIADVVYGGYYDFQFAINYVTHTFDISVTGFRADETPFSFQQSNIASINQTRSGLGSIHIDNNRGDINTLYVDSIAVIPEPAYIGVIAGIIALGAVVCLRRRKGIRIA